MQQNQDHRKFFPILDFRILQRSAVRWLDKYPLAGIERIALYHYASKHQAALGGKVPVRYVVVFYVNTANMQQDAFDELVQATERLETLRPKTRFLALMDAGFEEVYGTRNTVPANFRDHWMFVVMKPDDEYPVGVKTNEPHWVLFGRPIEGAETKPTEWITGAELLKQRKKPGNLYKLVVSGKVIPWIEVPPPMAGWETKSPVRRDRHSRLLPSYEADKKAQEINSLAFGIQSSERWLAQSNEEHYAVIKADSARKGKEPESYDSFKEYLSAVRREYDEKLPAMRADLDRLVKELDPATVWKTEFARHYPGGVPTSVKEKWLESFTAASYDADNCGIPGRQRTAALNKRQRRMEAAKLRAHALQEQRAKQGMPPLTAAEYAAHSHVLEAWRDEQQPAHSYLVRQIKTKWGLKLPKGRPPKK